MVLLKFKGYTSLLSSVKMRVSDSVSLGGAGDGAFGSQETLMLRVQRLNF